MMDVSIFLAKLFGLYFLIVGGFSLFRRKAFVSMLDEFFASRALLALSGFIILSVGLAIIIGHPVYTLDWRGLITLVGYLALVKGVVRIWYPNFLRSFAKKLVHNYFPAMLAIILILGVMLTYVGFAHS